MPMGALSNEQLEELDALLDELRIRGDEIPQWEFCDGFLTALVCTRRPIAAAEYMPMLLGDGEALELAEGQALPKLEVFKDEAQQARFMELFELRMNEVREQLNKDVKSLADEAAFQPEALDTRGAILMLPEAEQAELAGEEIPSFGQVWALGFMFVVENWAEDWAAPRDKEAAQMLDAAMEFIVNLTEDDTDEPALNLYDDQGPASTSQERVDAFGESIWAVYDLHQLWKSMGPRQETIVKGEQPGRNDPCPCGSGKKFKKCHGA
ncbi:YecA family protein [Comamonas testosteroni]|uniref:YecA family protein n=1 Tax=Comamonas testosteroni TaxID=285 RepID=A0A373FFS9_COMTE|nr:YecA family protein [Comamonas testosteroni]RGE42991.1 YecA family protein [Comamonas testosteroni]